MDGPVFRDTRIPTLEEIFVELGDRLLFNVELTNYRTPDDRLVERVVKLVQGMGMQSRVLLSSFFRRNLVEARKLAPEIPLGHLIGPTRLTVIDRLRGVHIATEAVHPHHLWASGHAVRAWHAQGRRVIVYTVDQAGRMEELWRMGVDGIITDDPGVARGTVDR